MSYNQWHQGMLNFTPPYPPPYPLHYQYPPDSYHMPPFHPSMMFPPMISPRYLYGVDPNLIPNYKAKYDPRNFGHSKNSYLEQLKPSLADIEKVEKKVTKSQNKLSKSIKINFNPNETTDNLSESPKSPNSYNNLSNNYKNITKTDSKFNFLMQKREEKLNKALVKNSNTNNDANFPSLNSIKPQQSNQSSATASNTILPKLKYEKNYEKQLTDNRNVILSNRKKIDKYNLDIGEHNKLINKNLNELDSFDSESSLRSGVKTDSSLVKSNAYLRSNDTKLQKKNNTPKQINNVGFCNEFSAFNKNTNIKEKV